MLNASELKKVSSSIDDLLKSKTKTESAADSKIIAEWMKKIEDAAPAGQPVDSICLTLIKSGKTVPQALRKKFEGLQLNSRNVAKATTILGWYIAHGKIIPRPWWCDILGPKDFPGRIGDNWFAIQAVKDRKIQMYPLGEFSAKELESLSSNLGIVIR